MLNVFVLVIIAVIVAMTWSEGFWSNALSFINAIFAAMVATNVYEPAADFMEGKAPSLTYFWDFLMLWLVFAFSFGIFRAITEAISKTRVRFNKPADLGGRAAFGFLTAWIVVCLFVFSLHMAPLVRSAFGGQFAATPTSSNFFLSPDRLWLGFMQSRSQEGGALSRAEPVPFDPNSDFILKYGQRRQQFSEMPSMTVDSRGRRRR